MKDRRSGGWWPSSVPNPAAAARRVSWWSRPEPPPPPQRPSSLVIVHCGPSSPEAPSSPSPSTPSVQRPSCSPPPPPPPRSPAASSYATADEEDDSPSPLEMPQSPDGELLQGILAIIEQKGVIARQTDITEEAEQNQQSNYNNDNGIVSEPAVDFAGEQKLQTCDINSQLNTVGDKECIQSECVVEFNSAVEEKAVSYVSSVPLPPPLPLVPPPIAREPCILNIGLPLIPPPPPPPQVAAARASCSPNTTRKTVVTLDSGSGISQTEYDRLPQDFILQIPRLNSANNSSNSIEIQSNVQLTNLETTKRTTPDFVPESIPSKDITENSNHIKQESNLNIIQPPESNSELIGINETEIVKIDVNCDVKCLPVKDVIVEKTEIKTVEKSDIIAKNNETVIYEAEVSITEPQQLTLIKEETKNRGQDVINEMIDCIKNITKEQNDITYKKEKNDITFNIEQNDTKDVKDDYTYVVRREKEKIINEGTKIKEVKRVEFGECSGVTITKHDADDDSSGAGPCDTSSSSDGDHDGDLTLDDATDITLDEDSTGSPLPQLPKDDNSNKPKNAEDEYFELARASHYENVDYRKKQGALSISKRKLQALHPPKLGAVKSGLSRAWGAMKDWGSENAKKLNDLVRETSVPQDEPESTPPPPVPPHALPTEYQQHSGNIDQGLTSPEASPPPPLRPRARVLSPERSPNVAHRRSMLAQAAARSAQAARRSRYLPHEGQSGFDELRRYMKQGGDFCKELSTILQERAEAEAQYAKSLSKLSAKLSRSAKEAVGSVSAAWQQAAIEMETEGEAHRDASAALADRVVRPLRATLEAQHRVRKSVETAVDKTGKGLAEWRVAEAKAKKHSFACARENERLQDALQEAQRLGRSGRTGTLSDKEVAKLESKRRKAEESVKKADVEYYTFCIRAERARLEWETAVSRGSQCFQALEEQRLQHLKELGDSYLQLLSQLGPRIVLSAERLTEPIQSCDVNRDLQTVASVKGVGQPIPEQLLPDFYPEHVTLAMNRERRRLALAKLLQLIRQDLERERRAKQGVENLARALQQTPTFGTEDSQQNVSDKLHHMRSMLTYLEAARYKVHSTLEELDGHSRASHPLASHIQITRDRQGLQQSILKVPPWVREESLDQLGGDAADWPDRGAADGNSVQPDSDFDEFSSQASDEKDFAAVIPVLGDCGSSEVASTANLGQCRALYDYTANLCDELNLRTGDVISVREKQEDGWWLGELNGVVGIFPATYVEEVGKT